MSVKAILAGALGVVSTNFCHGDVANFEKLVELRHSGRTYDGSKQVSQEQVQKLVEAARKTPSCYNDQPWYFIIGNKSTNPETYQKIFDSLVEFNQGWAKNAPVLVVAVSGTTFSRNGQPNRWAPYDTGAAAMSMLYQATSMGLMGHEMGGFDEVKIASAFDIPSEYVPMAVIAIGYEAEDAPEKGQPKDRKPAAQNFFYKSWGDVK